MPQLELDVGGQTHRVDIPQGQEVTPEYVQSVASRLGAAASPAKQGQAQAAATEPQAPGFGSALASQVAARTTQPAGELMSALRQPREEMAPGILSPQSSLDKILAAVPPAVNLATTAFAPAASGIGALTQAAAEASGVVEQGGLWSNVLGGIAEIGAGGVTKVYKDVVRPKRVASKLTAEVDALGGVDAWPQERISKSLRAAAHTALSARERPIKAVLNQMEASAGRHMMQDGSVAYGHTRAALDMISDLDLPLGKSARKYVNDMEALVAAGKPIPARNLVKLRHILKRPQFTGIVGDPNKGPAEKLIGNVRDRVTQGVEAAIRDSGDDAGANAYNAALRSYRINVADPKRAIRSVLSSKRSPMQAFTSAFNQKDPNILRTLTDLAQKSPAMQSKLRLGYFETLRAATKDFTNPGEMMTHFRRTRPLLEANKLFNAQELDDIASLMRRQDSLQRAGDAIASQLGRITTSAATGMMAGGAAYAYTQDPKYVAMVAMAGGAAPLVKQLAMLPMGSREGQRLAALIVRQVTKTAQNVFSEETRDPGEVEEVEP